MIIILHMRRTLQTAHSLLFTSFLASILLSASFLLSSCTPPTQHAPRTALYIYRFDPPAFLEYSEDLQLIKGIPFSIHPNCGLFNTFPASIGQYILIELSCPNGQTVLFLNTETASVSQPITNSDSHFLAWTSDGKATYLKIDSLGSPRVVRLYPDGTRNNMAIPEFTYDLAAKPDSFDFTFTLSRGLGYGSELYSTQYEVRNPALSEVAGTQLLYTDQFNYITFTRFSPDGKQIAFIKIPDTQTPFTVGELWVMDANGTNARKLADADAGHGYAANWSPDGTKIAFVVRENPDDENANQSSEALISNIYIMDVGNGTLTPITNFTEGHAETPHWSPDGNTLAFNAVINGRMNVFIVDVGSVGVGSSDPVSVEIKPLTTGSTCCPAWMRK